MNEQRKKKRTTHDARRTLKKQNYTIRRITQERNQPPAPLQLKLQGLLRSYLLTNVVEVSGFLGFLGLTATDVAGIMLSAPCWISDIASSGMLSLRVLFLLRLFVLVFVLVFVVLRVLPNQSMILERLFTTGKIK